MSVDDLTDNQKVIITVARWQSAIRVVGIAEAALPDVPRYKIAEYCRSDECLDRVAALFDVYGEYGE